MKFANDNKYLACVSMNPKETGGGLIYILKVEHNTDNIKQMNKFIN
jgi:hypothetical protein